MQPFKIGINMAGAVSAGAYTAGVLDFLTEALDEWHNAKARGDAVPTHDVSIEVMSGASAGGMCAAISSLMLQEEFEHIHDVTKTNTTNRFYESWVNKIDISQLLKTDDLKSAPPVVSLLDSSIITQIASYALTPSAQLAVPRAYVSPHLTLFLSLTNLRGVPYSLNGAAPGSVEETTSFFGDRIRFETLPQGQTAPLDSHAYPLDTSKPGAAGGWDVLQTAAAATGAFPIFLAPRILNRRLAEYTPPMWEPVISAAAGTPPPIPPNFPIGLQDPMVTLNVDGGITNNDPFNYAHDYLNSLQPFPVADGDDAEKAENADRAVISVAPFPTAEKFDTAFAARQESSIFSALPRLFSALISQSRFFGESLDQIMSGATFSRFVIAPSDPDMAAKGHSDKTPALQCAALGAFGGFFERGFRAHDYVLGRRNCQKFLTDYFVLPQNNVIMQPALQSLPPEIYAEVIGNFKRPAPGTYSESEAALLRMGQAVPAAQKTGTDIWLPIIPLCGKSVSTPIEPVPRARMASAALHDVVKLILNRFGAIIPILINLLPSFWLRSFLRIGQPVIRGLARAPLTDALIKALGDSYQP
jgi:predicted acylesterase/phospholipase RssA